MALYTLRIRLQFENGYQRGSNVAEMSHHFYYPDDDTALLALSGGVDHWVSSAIGKRWVAQRGGDVHEYAVFRRSTENPRSWNRLHTQYFSLAEHDHLEIPLTIEGVEIPLAATEAPILNDQRGAVMIRIANEANTITSRCYIGPISEVCWHGSLDLPWFGGAAILSGRAAPTFDFPYDPRADSVDQWRDNLLGIVSDHIRDLNDVAGPSGYLVVPSWSTSSFPRAATVRCSPVRAHIRTRGQRATMTEAVEIPT